MTPDDDDTEPEWRCDYCGAHYDSEKAADACCRD